MKKVLDRPCGKKQAIHFAASIWLYRAGYDFKRLFKIRLTCLIYMFFWGIRNGGKNIPLARHAED